MTFHQYNALVLLASPINQNDSLNLWYQMATVN